MKRKLLKILPIIALLILVLSLLSLGIKGKKDLTHYQNTKSTELSGPFEASNSTARYALTEAMIDNHSFTLNPIEAKFASPDMTTYKGKALSIFTPGVSFIGAPFYAFGKLFGLAQIFTYLSVTISALLNAILIYILARKIGTSKIASYISAVAFLFATNALPYAFGFTQHHFGLTIILLSVLNTMQKRNIINNFVLGILFSIGLMLDIPNSFLLLPVGLYVLSKHFSFTKSAKSIKVSFKTALTGIIIGLIPFIILFGIYNYQTTGSYTKIAQLIGRQDDNTPSKPIVKTNDYDKKYALNTRNELQGLYILGLSDERSWLWYSPIVFFGFLGLYISYHKKKFTTTSAIVLSIIFINFAVYSMFDDPWGGWSFGPRYLIPAAGLLCIFIGQGIDKYAKKIVFGFLFLAVAIYSIYITTLGTLTTTSIPPKQEAEALINPIPYTYKYNQKLAAVNISKTYVYDAYLSKVITVNQLVWVYSSVVFLMITIPYIYIWRTRKEEKI